VADGERPNVERDEWMSDQVAGEIEEETRTGSNAITSSVATIQEAA
jgi:hypothetical protein